MANKSIYVKNIEIASKEYAQSSFNAAKQYADDKDAILRTDFNNKIAEIKLPTFDFGEDTSTLSIELHNEFVQEHGIAFINKPIQAYIKNYPANPDEYPHTTFISGLATIFCSSSERTQDIYGDPPAYDFYSLNLELVIMSNDSMSSINKQQTIYLSDCGIYATDTTLMTPEVHLFDFTSVVDSVEAESLIKSNSSIINLGEPDFSVRMQQIVDDFKASRKCPNVIFNLRNWGEFFIPLSIDQAFGDHIQLTGTYIQSTAGSNQSMKMGRATMALYLDSTRTQYVRYTWYNTNNLRTYYPGEFLAKDNTNTYTPTANYHPATKKYVDDKVDSSGEVHYVDYDTSSSDTPFIFDGKKRGIYYINARVGARFYYKWTDEGTLKYLEGNDKTISYIIFDNDFIASEIETGVNFGYMYYKQGDSGNCFRTLLYKNHNDKLAFADEKFVDYSLTAGTQTINGVKTFNNIPKQADTYAPTQDTQFTNKKYVDDSIASAITDTINSLFFVGTQTEWDALTPEEQEAYIFAKITPGTVQLTQQEIQNIRHITGNVTNIESDLTLENALSAALDIAGEGEGE